MLIVESDSRNVYRNLAIEEYLMGHVVGQDPILFLWQGDCAVVMGKNQNPWRECRLDLMREEQVALARRISGGGTVYHDEGNLNYCVISDRRDYREDRVYEMVFGALEPFGIKAQRSGRSNLSVDGLKFSGNAFCFRGGRAMHHGTLLLNTDLERMGRYLGSMFDAIDTHAIASVPARVANLGLGIEAVAAALEQSFREQYPCRESIRLRAGSIDAKLLEPLMARQGSNEWIFLSTPRFLLRHGASTLDIRNGVVVCAEGDTSAEGWLDKHFSEVAFSLVC